MKKGFIRAGALLMTAVLAVLTAGCSSRKLERMPVAEAFTYSGGFYSNLAVAETVAEDGFVHTEAYEKETPTPIRQETSSGDTAGKTSADPQKYDGRKLIRTVRFTVETQDFDNSTALIAGMVNSCGGYVESSNVSGNSYKSDSGNRSATYLIRVPVSGLDAFLHEVGSIGNITAQSENEQDITLDYIDTASRIKSLETQRDSLFRMMEEAKELSDMLTIQDHLTNVLYQLERYNSQLRTMDNKVDYSSVSIELREVKLYTKPEPEPVTFLERLQTEFRESLQDVAAFFEDSAVFFIGNLPGILVFAAIVCLAVLLLRRIFRKRRMKKAARRTAEAEQGKQTPGDQ